MLFPETISLGLCPNSIIAHLRMNDRPGWIKPAFLVLLGLVCLGASRAALGAQASTASAASTRSLDLEYRELGYSVGTWTIPITLQSTPFKKEPELGQHKVYRGTLKFGDSTDAFVPFIWDPTQGKLHLDLNRNQDLTDDEAFACAGRPNSSDETFSRVRMSFKTPLGMEQMAMDLLFTDARATPNAYASAFCCWEAKVTQGGQDWQLALVDNPSGKLGSAENGSLIIRPWADRDKAVGLEYGQLDCLPFTPNVFFGQRAYRLGGALAGQDNRIKYRLNLTERPEELGELKLAGQHIHRLILTRTGPGGATPSGIGPQEATAGRYAQNGRMLSPAPAPSLTVILDSPAPVVRIPVGSYFCQLCLKQGEVVARPLLTSFGANARNSTLVVSATKAATLAFGGPLTNSVAVTRRGRSLAMNYRLLGAQGEAYQLEGPRKQPEFTIYRPGKNGDKKLASGAFQFG